MPILDITLRMPASTAWWYWRITSSSSTSPNSPALVRSRSVSKAR